MKSTALTIVPQREPTLAERITALQAELAAVGREQITAMREQIGEALSLASEVAANPSQPPGVRQVAERVVRDAEAVLLTLKALTTKGN